MPNSMSFCPKKSKPTDPKQFQLRSKCTMFLLLKSSTTQAIVLSSSSPEDLVPSPVSAKESVLIEGWMRIALHKGTCHFTPSGSADKFKNCRLSKLGEFKSWSSPAKGSSCTMLMQPAKFSFSRSREALGAGVCSKEKGLDKEFPTGGATLPRMKNWKRYRNARSEIAGLPSKSNSRTGYPMLSISQIAKTSRSARPCDFALIQSECPVTNGSVEGRRPSRLHAFKYFFVDANHLPPSCPASQGRWNLLFCKRFLPSLPFWILGKAPCDFVWVTSLGKCWALPFTKSPSPQASLLTSLISAVSASRLYWLYWLYELRASNLPASLDWAYAASSLGNQSHEPAEQWLRAALVFHSNVVMVLGIFGTDFLLLLFFSAFKAFKALKSFNSLLPLPLLSRLETTSGRESGAVSALAPIPVLLRREDTWNCGQKSFNRMCRLKVLSVCFRNSFRSKASVKWRWSKYIDTLECRNLDVRKDFTTSCIARRPLDCVELTGSTCNIFQLSCSRVSAWSATAWAA